VVKNISAGKDKEEKMKSKVLWFVICLMFSIAILWTSCSQTPAASPAVPSSQPPSSPAAPAPNNQPQPSVQAPIPGTQTNAASKTLKIGVVAWFADPVGLDTVHGTQLMADMVNTRGGLNIGGDKYTIQVVVYDNGQNQATEVSAINRLVFVDNVKFIIAQAFFMDAWLPLTDSNKVLVATVGPPFPTNLAPNYRYTFNPTSATTGLPIFCGWFVKILPNLAKSIVLASTDNQPGHILTGLVQASFGAFGPKPEVLFYPAASTDLSSLGTKVKSLNPTAFCAIGGGPSDPVAFTAVNHAGYTGQLFTPTAAAVSNLGNQMPSEILEGFLCEALPTNFDPALTKEAQDFKVAWNAKYNKWDYPQVAQTTGFACIMTALEQTGSLDVDKVAAVIFNGLKYKGPSGSYQMISRPDMGNDRTVDSISESYIQKINKLQGTVIATIGIDEGLGYFRTASPQRGPGGAPPPPGP
jgi:ABC-type branched-subunit amino acid transport system substrate-binding protein